MSSALLSSDGRPLDDIEAALRARLPMIDVRLWPLGPTRAIVRGHVLATLRAQFPDTDYATLLAYLGIADVQEIDGEAAQALRADRERERLPRRAPLDGARAVAAAAAAGAPDWHLVQSGVVAAWGLLGGPDAIDWQGVRVGLIDTGYTPHPAFLAAGVTWLATREGRTFVPPPDTEVAVPPFEPGDGRDNLEGANRGHGTRMGSTICGHDPAAPGAPFYGVAPRVPLVPVRITDSVAINHRQREFRQAVRYLVREARVDVINVSLGVGLAAVRREMLDAVNEAYDAGVIMVCAAGNIIDPVVAPARLNRTLAVGGVTRADVPWSGSSFGPETDFCSYAADLRRADVSASMRFSYGGGGDGTSYATAITTGTAALWLAYRRLGIAQAYTQPWQRVEAFRTLARATARVPGPGWRTDLFGAGILNVRALLDAPLPAPSQQPAPPA